MITQRTLSRHIQSELSTSARLGFSPFHNNFKSISLILLSRQVLPFNSQVPTKLLQIQTPKNSTYSKSKPNKSSFPFLGRILQKSSFVNKNQLFVHEDTKQLIVKNLIEKALKLTAFPWHSAVEALTFQRRSPKSNTIIQCQQ